MSTILLPVPDILCVLAGQLALITPSTNHVDLYIDAVLQFTFRHSQISRYSTLIFGVPVTLPSAPICVYPTWIGSRRRCLTHVLKKRVTTINW